MTQGTPVNQVLQAPATAPAAAPDSSKALAALRTPSELSREALPTASEGVVIPVVGSSAPLPPGGSAPPSPSTGTSTVWIVAAVAVLALALFHPSAVAATERILPPALLPYDTFVRCGLLAAATWFLLEGDLAGVV